MTDVALYPYSQTVVTTVDGEDGSRVQLKFNNKDLNWGAALISPLGKTLDISYTQQSDARANASYKIFYFKVKTSAP